VFLGAGNATVYYLMGTMGWENFAQSAGLTTVPRFPQAQISNANYGVKTNRFGFGVFGTSGLVIVVEACTNLANPVWFPVGTNTLTGGSSYFSDPEWTNSRSRFYHLRLP